MVCFLVNKTGWLDQVIFISGCHRITYKSLLKINESRTTRFLNLSKNFRFRGRLNNERCFSFLLSSENTGSYFRPFTSQSTSGQWLKSKNHLNILFTKMKFFAAEMLKFTKIIWNKRIIYTLRKTCYWIFRCTWIFEMAEKIKMEIDRLLLVLKMKTNFRYILIKLNFFQFRNQK